MNYKHLNTEQKYVMNIINKFLSEISSINIFCDMDGCLVDFLKQADSILGMPMNEFEKKYGKSSMWSILIKHGSKFWSEMDWLPGGQKLWKFILPYKPTILSKPLNNNSSRIGKRIWIEKHLGKNIPYIFEPDKAKYADSKSILIDDDVRNVYPWKKAGGIAILHQNANETIGKLKNILR